MHSAEADQGDLGAGMNLINSLFSNWIRIDMRKTLDEAGILGQQSNSRDEDEDNENSVAAKTKLREMSVDED